MGLGFESQADHDDLYIRHNVRFYARYVFVSCVFLFVLHTDTFSLAPSRPLHVSNRVNQGLRGEVLPRSAFCSMRNQRSPLPLLMQYGEGMLTVVRLFIVGAAFPKRAAAHPQIQVCSAVLCSPQLSLSSCAG